LACSANTWAASTIPRNTGRRDQLDPQVALARLREQRLGLLEVLLALGEVLGVARVEGRVEVVRDPALAAEDLLDHLLAIDDQPERLADLDVVERSGVDAHRERLPRAGLGDHRAQLGVALDGRELAERHVVDRLDLTAEQRVDPCRVVGEVDDHELVRVGLAVAPVVLVALERALLARRQALELERAGADGLVRVVVDRHDAVEVLADVLGERGVGELQRDPHRALVELLESLRVHVSDRRRADLGVLRIEDPAQREDHVVGGHRLAVVELDALLSRTVQRSARPSSGSSDSARIISRSPKSAGRTASGS
jgi:hypothetical protein